MKKKAIDINKSYSAREALQYVTSFSREVDFRKFLKDDIAGKNIFNARVYTISSQPRFIIKGSDLLVALEKMRLTT